jgi:hypothetical protein
MDPLQHHSESDASWLDVATVADFLAYLAFYDRHHICAHDRRWTQCWECGHFEDYLDDAELDDSID